MDPEIKVKRIEKNLLKTVDIQLIRGFFRRIFSKTVIAQSGFAGGRTMVSREVYRMTVLLRFLGRNFFLSADLQKRRGKDAGWRSPKVKVS